MINRKSVRQSDKKIGSILPPVSNSEFPCILSDGRAKYMRRATPTVGKFVCRSSYEETRCRTLEAACDTAAFFYVGFRHPADGTGKPSSLALRRIPISIGRCE